MDTMGKLRIRVAILGELMEQLMENVRENYGDYGKAMACYGLGYIEELRIRNGDHADPAFSELQTEEPRSQRTTDPSF